MTAAAGIVSLVCAVADNGVMGVDNHLPWRLPTDLQRFKTLTMGHHIIMGRKTYESIGQALPGRTNLVVTRQPDFQAAGCQVVHSLDEALAQCQQAEEVFVIGGAELFAQALDRAARLYLTQIHATIPGDTYFPALDSSQWREIAHEDHAADAMTPYAYSFLTLERLDSAHGPHAV